MQLIGFLGGMSWESSAEYYRLANTMIRDRLGALHSARCILYSVDFAEIERMQTDGRWDDAAAALATAAESLESAGSGAMTSTSSSRPRTTRPPCTA